MLCLGLVLVPILFLWPVLAQFWYQIRRRPPPEKSKLSLWHRGMCVLLAYIFLLGPQCFQMLSDAAVQYSNISRLAWGDVGEVFSYFYDDNGSMTYKICGDVDTGGEPEVIISNDPCLLYENHEYNLQNRLCWVRKAGGGNIAEITEYRYNPQGIRVQKHTWTEDDGTPQGDDVYTAYLVDMYNHTGYAQVVEETTDDGTNLTRVQYTIGDDVISQTESTWSGSAWTATDTKYLLYDGHGSTRQLLNTDLTVAEAFSYDGYGVMLGGNPADTSNSTSLLYSGEQFDTDLQQYYLRARYYDQNNGRFNRMDPFAGNMQDPQSLHKYLYCHANPINNIDPTGKFSFVELLTVAAIVGGILAATAGLVTAFNKESTVEDVVWAQVKWFIIGFLISAAIYGAFWSLRTLWFWIFPANQIASNPGIQSRLHHFASSCHSYWTDHFKQIASRFNLNINDAWNLGEIPYKYHNSNHAWEYHEWVFQQMTRAANEAGQSTARFIILYHEYVVFPVTKCPEMLKPEFWPKGG